MRFLFNLFRLAFSVAVGVGFIFAILGNLFLKCEVAEPNCCMALQIQGKSGENNGKRNLFHYYNLNETK